METQRVIFSLSFLTLLFLTLFSFYSNTPLLTSLNKILRTIDDKVGGTSHVPQIYIVHVEEPPFLAGVNTTKLADEYWKNWHSSFLPSATLSSGKPRMIYSYKHAISGFAAWLTPREVNSMESMEGFLVAYPARRRKAHTTYSPKFLGLSEGQSGQNSFWSQTNNGTGVIIGVVDYGIDPSHPSFSDDGLPSPPSKWKGTCGFSSPLRCNNKLIGAAGFKNGNSVSPLDGDGHGTNCASSAAGNFVQGASVLGQAKGIAAGTAPHAHVAMYKACDEEGCEDIDITAAMDQAMADGVDVLSISLGAGSLRFYQDVVAIAAYRATAKGIFLSLSAGNDGPTERTIENHAPWMLTVGASTLDRSLRATVKLGNNQDVFYGESAYQPINTTGWLPLVYPGKDGSSAALACTESGLAKFDLKGKVVMCQNGGEPDAVGKGKVVLSAGGIAMIVLNQRSQEYTTEAKAHVLPASHINYDDVQKLIEYVKSNSSPTAQIVFEGTKYGTPPSPSVTYFSGRGPNTQNGGILKPDIIGPGHNILVATPFSVGPQPSNASRFDMTLGTSIATPQLSGIVALLRVAHPDWSPAAIKSAIMTTAETVNHEGKSIVDETGNPAKLYALGSGHVSPAKANDPGLIYDLEADDYIPYLCGLDRYTDKEVAIVTGRQRACSTGSKIKVEQLNYPSISVAMNRGEKLRNLSRTVTNVGEAESVYVAKIDQPKGVEVTVTPDKLAFQQLGQKATYEISITSLDSSAPSRTVYEGQLWWVSDRYLVRSPILVRIN